MHKLGFNALVIICFCSMFPEVNGQTHQVDIQTNMGNMRFELFDNTPKHRDEFIRLAREGYYNGTLFYRVIKDFMIQGGSASTKNAPPGARIGYGDPDYTVDDEIRDDHFHHKGALCAPRQDDANNPFKQSDISQFYVVKGRVYSSGELDTMELVVNRPIRNKITKEIYTAEIKEKLQKLREENKTSEFRELAGRVKSDIEANYNLQPGTLKYTDEQRTAFTTIGGYPNLDGQYTIFGRCISGMEVIDKISAMKVDKNNRPLTDVKITVKVVK